MNRSYLSFPCCRTFALFWNLFTTMDSVLLNSLVCQGVSLLHCGYWGPAPRRQKGEQAWLRSIQAPSLLTLSHSRGATSRTPRGKSTRPTCEYVTPTPCSKPWAPGLGAGTSPTSL